MLQHHEIDNFSFVATIEWVLLR